MMQSIFFSINFPQGRYTPDATGARHACLAPAATPSIRNLPRLFGIRTVAAKIIPKSPNLKAFRKSVRNPNMNTIFHPKSCKAGAIGSGETARAATHGTRSPTGTDVAP